MRLFVPEIGTKITLELDWTFSLYDEGRNESLFTCIDDDKKKGLDLWTKGLNDLTKKCDDIRNRLTGIPFNSTMYRAIIDEFNKAHSEYLEYRRNKYSLEVTIPKGTVLIMDRVYIRKNASEYSSLTFIIESSPDPKFAPTGIRKGFNHTGAKRFWAKLSDCNKLHFDEFALLNDGA